MTDQDFFDHYVLTIFTRLLNDDKSDLSRVDSYREAAFLSAKLATLERKSHIASLNGIKMQPPPSLN